MSGIPQSRPQIIQPSRRDFLATAGSAAIVASAATPLLANLNQAAAPDDPSANLTRQLFMSLSPKQRKEICFDWDHTTPEHGKLRLHVSNNWQITPHKVISDFYTADQQDIIEALFWSLYSPEWKSKIQKQLNDDAEGYGKGQSIAIFGNPQDGPFELVMTGRHLTIRCDGNSTEHTAFGGPIFYGHAAQGFDEEPDHPGNVFWAQAVRANEIFGMLDGRQRTSALLKAAPNEEEVHFRAQGEIPGLPVSELADDQKKHMESVLSLLLEPYRQLDRKEALTCLEAQGGLDACRLSFYESDDVGQDKIWDTWRLEGPSFVWHYRGDPHVHVWVHVADDPSVQITTEG